MKRLLLILLAAAPQDEVQGRADGLAELWDTRWYGFVSGESKIGFGAFVTRNAGDALEFEDVCQGVRGGAETAVRVLMRCARDEHMTPRRIKVESEGLSYELDFKEGLASATIGGARREVEITADTVTIHSIARLVCVLPREAGFERKLRYLNLETLETVDTKLSCDGEQRMEGAKVPFTGVRYRLWNREPLELWVNEGVLWGLEGSSLGAAVLSGSELDARRGYRPDVLVCAANLRSLAALQHEYAKRFGGRDGAFNRATGKGFWLALAGTEPPLIEERRLSLLLCPATGTRPGPGLCSYRGPRVDVNTLGPEAIVGCDDPLNHPDGMHAITLSGKVHWVKRDTEEYGRLLRLLAE